jgi:hypothetical protein
MSVFEKYVSAWNAQDVDAMIAITHEDYMYLTLDSLVARSGLFREFRNGWSGRSWANSDFKLVIETEDVMVITFSEMDENGKKAFRTETCLLQDGKIWRSASKAVPV